MRRLVNIFQPLIIVQEETARRGSTWTQDLPLYIIIFYFHYEIRTIVLVTKSLLIHAACNARFAIQKKHKKINIHPGDNI